MRNLLRLSLLPASLLLAGCDFVVLSPAGDVAVQERDLTFFSAVLMLVVVLPVMAMVVLFAYRYRASSTGARYEPDWHHSAKLELAIWSVPLLIVICLGALTMVGTHLLDPYRRIGRIAPDHPVDPAAQPLVVQVVALDWKWLFFYPEYGIATVNELTAPLNREIAFKITASSIMNSFYVPALAGQIYAMAGMETKLHAVVNKPGSFNGFSANYSGAGFSGMRFKFHAIETGAFDEWIAQTKAAPAVLDRGTYLDLERPSENVPVKYFGKFDDNLYRDILNICVDKSRMCVDEMMMIDAEGGRLDPPKGGQGASAR